MQVLGGVGVRGAQQPADELEARAIIAVVETRKGVWIAGAVGAQQGGVVRSVVIVHSGRD